MSTKKPMVLCFAGPNGSGKSTITKFFDIVGIYINKVDFNYCKCSPDATDIEYHILCMRIN